MNRRGNYANAVGALEWIAGRPVDMTFAGCNAPDQALRFRCMIQSGTEVDPADRHFAGEAMLFSVTTTDGTALGAMVIDEEVIHSVDEWDPGNDLELELGDVKIYVSSITGSELS